MLFAWQMRAPGFLNTGADGALLSTCQGPIALSVEELSPETVRDMGFHGYSGLSGFCFSISGVGVGDQLQRLVSSVPWAFLQRS